MIGAVADPDLMSDMTRRRVPGHAGVLRRLQTKAVGEKERRRESGQRTPTPAPTLELEP